MQDGAQAGRQEAGQAGFNSKGLAAILVEVAGWIQAWSNRLLRCGWHRHWPRPATILISVALLWDLACEMKAQRVEHQEEGPPQSPAVDGNNGA